MIPLILMHGCGNYFFLIDEWEKELVADKTSFVKSICDAAEGESVDGVLFLGKTDYADVEMRIFDRDGSEETMCGNGIRCVGRYFFDHYTANGKVNVKTLDGIKQIRRCGDLVEVNMGPPRGFRKLQEGYFVFTGCPHFVILDSAHNLSDIRKIEEIGRSFCHNPELCSKLGISPAEGVYIDFVQSSGKMNRVITYERHVERCTLACGTGSAAAGYVLHKVAGKKLPIIIKNRGGVMEISMKQGNLIKKGPAEYIKTVFVNYNF